MEWIKGQLILKELFGILEFFRKTNERIRHSTVITQPQIPKIHVMNSTKAMSQEGLNCDLKMFMSYEGVKSF